MRMQIGSAFMEINMEGPQKINYRTTIWPSDTISGYIPGEF